MSIQAPAIIIILVILIIIVIIIINDCPCPCCSRRRHHHHRQHHHHRHHRHHYHHNYRHRIQSNNLENNFFAACDPNACLHGGTCHERPGEPEGFICECPQHFFGLKCENVSKGTVPCYYFSIHYVDGFFFKLLL